MEEGLPDDGPSRRQPLQNWGEARRDWGRNPRASRPPLPPVSGWCLQRPEVWVKRSTEISLLGYTAGQRKGMVWWSRGTRGKYPHIRLPHQLCQRLTPLQGARTTPENISQGQVAFPGEGSTVRVHDASVGSCLTLYISLSLSHLPAQPSWALALLNSVPFPASPPAEELVRGFLPDTF